MKLSDIFTMNTEWSQGLKGHIIESYLLPLAKCLYNYHQKFMRILWTSL